MHHRTRSRSVSLFTERLATEDVPLQDVTLARVPIPARRLIGTLDENPHAAVVGHETDIITLDPSDRALSEAARILAEDLAILVKLALREGSTVILLCCPARDETIAQAVSHGFCVYAVDVKHDRHRLHALPGRARKLLTGPDGSAAAFACDAENADILRTAVEAVPPRAGRADPT